jgi:hypothetical protein
MVRVPTKEDLTKLVFESLEKMTIAVNSSRPQCRLLMVPEQSNSFPHPHEHWVARICVIGEGGFHLKTNLRIIVIGYYKTCRVLPVTDVDY